MLNSKTLRTSIKLFKMDMLFTEMQSTQLLSRSKHLHLANNLLCRPFVMFGRLYFFKSSAPQPHHCERSNILAKRYLGTVHFLWDRRGWWDLVDSLCSIWWPSLLTGYFFPWTPLINLNFFDDPPPPKKRNQFQKVLSINCFHLSYGTCPLCTVTLFLTQ